MTKKRWLSLGILALAALGVIVTKSLTGDEQPVINKAGYSLDGTLEPEEIPGMSPQDAAFSPADGAAMKADAPVQLPEIDNTAAGLQQEVAGSPEDCPLILPQRFRADGTIMEEPHNEYALVQYRYRSKTTQQDSSNSSKPQYIASPSVQEISSLTETEQAEALKKAIRATLKANMRRAITTQHNDPGDILSAALPYGADARVYQPNTAADLRDKTAPRGSYIYSIGTLCWNYPCAGKTLLRTDGKRVYARVGAGYQNRQSSLLALLAMSNIMPNYEIKVNGGVYNIGHLIASEKASVSRGCNLSMTLVGLSFYGEAKDQWKNEMGETWDIERIVTEELNRSIDQGASDVTDWLLGLTSAVKLYEEEGKMLRGPMALAKKQLGTYHDFVLSVQNENYLWHPKFFLFKGVGADNFETLYSSGHILQWLMFSLSDNHLKDVKVRKAITGLMTAVNRVPTNAGAGTLSPKQLEGLAVSLHALALYHQRVYGDEPEEEEKAPEKKPETNQSKTVAQR
ncbi:MAG: hypothetical protein LBN39_03195 [Planctomycetaceae bacterium]|jgi:hypothetical protein|nr:hypothetical protein [Planctomycetaceae bacterium]